MSRSKKKPIYKDKGNKKDYWKTVRRVTKHALRNGDENLPDPKEIVNDYEYCDFIIDFRFHRGRLWFRENKEKASRK